MNRFQTLLAASAAFFALPAFADGVQVSDPYAITTGASGGTGAVFFTVHNDAAADDRLIAVASDVAEKVELHTHTQDANGVMSMTAVPEGFALPASGDLVLQRGGKHVMLMGLAQPLKDGDTFTLSLTFEHAGAVNVEVAVDNEHKPAEGEAAMDMSN